MANNISRRAFIGLKRALAPAEETSPRGIFSGLEPYTGAWTDAEVRHLLRRTTFSVKQAHLDLLKNMTISKAVDTLLEEQAALPAPVNSYTGYSYEENGKTHTVTDPKVALGATWVNAEFDLEVEFWRNMSLKGWWLRSMLEQSPSIHEKMTLFWHNHIPIQMLEVYNARLSYRYLLNLRSNALGNFKTLVKDVTIAPAMLYYLNGTHNEKWQPDENYARELQELFCVGKGPNSKFTEEDVQAAARVLTGWKADWNTQTVYFNNNVHDTDDKQFSSFYNNTVIKGKTGQDGKKELDELLDMIFANDEVALFVCRKLYRFFVHAKIDAVTEENIIKPLAAIFQQNNYNIKPVLEKLLKSQHFFDNLNRSVLIKTPIDLALGLCREFNVKFPEPSNHLIYFTTMNSIYWWLEGMNMGLGEPPNVAGWPAWYQQPQYDRSWISTSSIAKRADNTNNMIYWGYGDNVANFTKIDEFEFTKSLKKAADVNELIKEVLERMFPFSIGEPVKKHLKSLLLYNQTNEQYWTNAWNDYLQNPTDEMKINNVRWRIKPFYQYLLQLEEYQLH